MLFFLKVWEEIKNNASLGMKKLIKNTDQTQKQKLISDIQCYVITKVLANIASKLVFCFALAALTIDKNFKNTTFNQEWICVTFFCNKI